MEDIIYPDADSHWSLKVVDIMKPYPNTTSGIIKYKLISFFYPPYLIERTEVKYIVPEPELNLWYVLVGFLILMSIISYMAHKEIAAIIKSRNAVIVPDIVDLVEAIKLTKQTIRADVFAEKGIIETEDLLVDEVWKELGLPNKEGIGDSRNPGNDNNGATGLD